MEKGGTLSSLPSLASFSKCAEAFRGHCWKEDPGPVGPAGLTHCGCIPGPGRNMTVELHHAGLQPVVRSAHVSGCLWWPERSDK